MHLTILLQNYKRETDKASRFVRFVVRNKYKLGVVGVICHPERSEGSPIAQNKNMRNEILRLTAQNDNACVGVGEIPLLGEMSRSDKGVMA